MENLIPVINKLQDVFNAIGGDSIDLPQIAVVGTQSSGKSSVLENIVGRDFLPRGSGIVTRRPLILQLINIHPDPGVPADKLEWGEFLHKPNEVFYDFSRIREEIEAETNRTTGAKGISPVPIRLRVYSPHVLNLTLVDLPGMTRIPVGDQPKDIEEQIKRMILHFIEKPNCIILSVTAANTDLSTSDAIQLSKEVDPEGKRTLGVITKIDIMDKGTDAMDILLGRVIPLRLGFIGIVNRSQADISGAKSIRSALKSEADFFSTHSLYRTIANRCGTPFLTKTLQKLLMNHIRDNLPDLKMKIQKMMIDAQNELNSYGDSMFDNKQSQGALLLQIITKFSNDYRDSIEGKISELSVNELYGGARINYIFTEVFSKCLRSVLPNDGLTLNDIRTAIKNATGPRASLFVPEISFELLVRKQIMRLEDPSLQCVELVYDELQRIISQLESKELLRFQLLREKVVEVVNGLLHNCKIPTRQMIQNLIAIENAYINTNHEDFIGGGGAMTKLFEKMARQSNEQSSSGYVAVQPVQGGQSAPSQGMGPPPGQSGSASSSSAAGNPQNQPGFLNKFFGGQQPGQPGGQQPGQPGGPRPGQPGGPPPGQPGPGGPPPGMPRPGQQPGPGGPPPGMPRPGMPAPGGPMRLDTPPPTLKAQVPQNDKERFETELIQNLLSSYFDIVRKNIGDSVPKSIMHFLVNCSKENIQNELVRNLYKEELFDILLEESPVTAQRRQACKTMLEALKHANDVLNDVRDFHVI